MENNARLLIYQGIIQYLLESTKYTLKNIADLSDTPVKEIQEIFHNESLTIDLSGELGLIKLYHIIRETHIKMSTLDPFEIKA